MGHFKTIDLLIKCGADINASDCNQCTPLHVAAANGEKTPVTSKCSLLLEYAYIFKVMTVCADYY